MSDADKLRRVYGRGYMDGYHKGLNSMNGALIAEKEKNLTGIVRKVLEATPITQEWRVSKILEEMRRVGHGADHPSVASALDRLKGMGLVKEPVAGAFVRAIQKPQRQDQKVTPTKLESIKRVECGSRPDDAQSEKPVDRLGSIAAEVRTLSTRFAEIARQIDEVALDVQASMETSTDDMRKFKQLQELLKSI
jgi:hypothetical protein